MGADAFVQAVTRRRSIYAIGKDLPCPPQELVKLIEEVARQVPSSFNGHSCRVIIVFHKEHEKLWDAVKAAIRKVTNDEQYKVSEAKVDKCFKAGAGTILFYYDRQVVEAQQAKMPLYAKNFPTFAQQSSAMTQYAVWTALSEAGVGATLQHYNELIGTTAREMYKVPEKWELVAQMPFGSIKGSANAKTFLPNKERFRVIGLDSKL